MNNKYVYMIVASIFGVGAYMIGTGAYYGMDGTFSDNWWWATIFAVALGAGNNSGDDVVSILKDGVMGAIPMLISLGVFAVVVNLALQLIMGAAVDAMATVHAVATFVVAALFANIFLGYLKKSM